MCVSKEVNLFVVIVFYKEEKKGRFIGITSYVHWSLVKGKIEFFLAAA